MLLKDERGSSTVEAAVITPIILAIVMLFILVTVRKYEEGIRQSEEIHMKYRNGERNPVSVINNTDLVIEYIDKIKSYFKGE